MRTGVLAYWVGLDGIGAKLTQVSNKPTISKLVSDKIAQYN
jgi:hypothetical protein